MERTVMSDGELVNSSVVLDADGKQEGYGVDAAQGAEKEGFEVDHHEIRQGIDGKDETDRNRSPGDLFGSELETRQEGVGAGQSGERHESSQMLIDSAHTDGNAVALGSIIGEEEEEEEEENSVMDAAEMCYGSVVQLPTLPREGSHEVEGAPVDYAETYMSSPGEREGELISTVRPLSSTFFQTSGMHVAGSTAMTAPWEDIHSTHAESAGYGTRTSSFEDRSPGSGNSTEERAFVDSFCEEPLKDDSMDVGKNDSISGRSLDDVGTKNTGKTVLQSCGGLDTKNEDDSSSLTADDRGEGRPSGAREGKDKVPMAELSLRKVLSDPVTGAFMDDAMVAMCGHSFGRGGLQRVLETHSCVSCGASVLPKTLVPNFALRAAVLAYKHEDPLNSVTGTKRSRDQFEMPESSEPKGTSSDPGGSAENAYSDARAKGVQFPFAVSDRVVIKGNKRTPERFFGVEAIITSQCLNGWYLVRTLDTGESVRFQYRSLQKLGETDSPATSEPRLSAEHQIGSGCTPLSVDNPNGHLTTTGPASKNDLEPQSLTSTHNNENITCSAAEIMKVQSSDRESNATLEQSLKAADGERCPALNGGSPTNCSQEGGRSKSNSHGVDSLFTPVDSSNDKGVNPMETLEGDDQDALHAGYEKSSDDLPKSHDTTPDKPDADQLLHTGLSHDAGAKVQVGTSRNSPETPILKNEQALPTIVPTERLGETTDGSKLQTVVSNQTNGNEALRTRSRRSALHLKSSAASGGFLQDSDPYRKVYTSGSRRRSIKDESVITVIPDHLPADSKSLLKGTNNNEKGSEKIPAKGLNVGGLGTGKQGRDLKLKSATEILQIMRKDMLTLEKQVPQNYLLRSWKVRRVRWQKQVRTSDTVLEIGAQVRDFRYSLLLTNAGGMSDEEWDMRIAQIMESGDVELLVSLWGRLYSDVHKWLECRPKGLTSKDIQVGKALTSEGNDPFQKHNPNSSMGAVSSVQMTTAATLAAVDAVAEHQHDVDSSIKALLASTIKILQKQSRSELSTVREALEWEKRHITAKLQYLEQRFANLQGTTELDGLEAKPVEVGALLIRTSPTRQHASASTDQISQGVASVTPLDERHGYETEEYESDHVLPAQDEDGEATDMSDSD